MHNKIPVTVVTGFLGAGKTTLVRHLLQNNQGRKIAVIVNEFGEVGIDGELLQSCQICDEETPENNIIELANGCLCCTVQEEFLPTMQQLLQRKNNLDCIVIETSGLALPKPLVQAFRWPGIRNGATVDGVVTVVDAQALVAGTIVGDVTAVEQQRKADPNLDHETPIEELFEDQLACADLVLLTKTDLIESDKLTPLQQWLQQQLPDGVKIVNCRNGEIGAEVLLGLDAAVESIIDSRHSHHDHDEDHEHDKIDSLQLTFDSPFEPQQLSEKLQNLVQQQEIYRIKGFVNVADKPMRMVLQGVGNRFDSFYDRMWSQSEPRQTRLVVIGKQLNQREIEQAILS